MVDCLDCKHCKIKIKDRILRCKAKHWLYDGLKEGLKEKVIKLTDVEANTLRIKGRKIFVQGEKCQDMTNMND